MVNNDNARRFGLGLAVLMLTACSHDPAIRFYMLNSDASVSSQATPAFNNKLLVGLGPLRFPDYLDRPQLVMEVSPNQYRLDEHQRWAERLEQNSSRVLAQFLAERLGVDQIIRYPWAQRQHVDYQVQVDVLQFHQSADGYSRLQALWQIRRQDQTLLSRHFNCRLAAEAEAAAIVKAQSRCLSELGADIESGLRQVAAE